MRPAKKKGQHLHLGPMRRMNLRDLEEGEGQTPQPSILRHTSFMASPPPFSNNSGPWLAQTSNPVVAEQKSKCPDSQYNTLLNISIIPGICLPVKILGHKQNYHTLHG